MASSTDSRQLQKLKEENRRLRQDNVALRQKLATETTTESPTTRAAFGTTFLRRLTIIVLIGLASGLLVAGNLLFWAGNTIVKTDRYVEATAPIIQNEEVQKAIAQSATDKLFDNVNVEQVIEDSLPPRASFLGPTLTDQIRQHTDDAILKILERPQFQERWNASQERSHERFIKLVSAHGSDGTIDVSEVYTDVSQQLKDTRLSFLADKPLPAKVGTIEVVSGSWLTLLQRTIQNIDTWRIIAIVLLVVCSFFGVWLSRNRRKSVIILGSIFAAVMFITLISMRLTREMIAGSVDPAYAEAVRQTYTIFMHPLVVQTWTLFAAGLLVAVIAWISGGSSASLTVRQKVDQLFSGKLHEVIFGTKENRFTTWVGAHKNALQWIIVFIVAVTTLFVRLTPGTLAAQICSILVLVLILEILAAKPTKLKTKTTAKSLH